MKRYSILSQLDYCIKCNKPNPNKHEVMFGTKNRQKSIKWGLIIPLCPYHHNMSNEGIHYNIKFDIEEKIKAQLKAMKHYKWSEQDFIDEFGESYLHREKEESKSERNRKLRENL